MFQREDGKRFELVSLAHWSEIRAEDGEVDHVKWWGGADYIGRSGHSYKYQKVEANER